jgi:hypothetical protein
MAGYRRRGRLDGNRLGGRAGRIRKDGSLREGGRRRRFPLVRYNNRIRRRHDGRRLGWNGRRLGWNGRRLGWKTDGRRLRDDRDAGGLCQHASGKQKKEGEDPAHAPKLTSKRKRIERVAAGKTGYARMRVRGGPVRLPIAPAGKDQRPVIRETLATVAISSAGSTGLARCIW